jgi:hypothetical protein
MSTPDFRRLTTSSGTLTVSCRVDVSKPSHVDKLHSSGSDAEESRSSVATVVVRSTKLLAATWTPGEAQPNRRRSIEHA